MIRTMKILDIELKYSLRMFVAFEGITGKPFALDGYTDLIALILGAVITAPSVRSGQSKCPTADEVYDYLDEHPEAITEFSAWLEQSARPDDMMASEDDTGKKKD